MSYGRLRSNRALRAIARRVRCLRGQAGFTQQQVATCLGLRRPGYTEIELARREISLLEGYRLARLFDVTMDELLGGVGRAGRDPGQPAGRMRPPRPGYWPRHRRDMGQSRA